MTRSGWTRSGWCAAFLASWLVSIVAGQEPAEPPARPKSPVRGAFASSGVRRYTPGVWGQIVVTLDNNTDRVQSGTAELSSGDDLQLQFVRRFRLPPHCERQIAIPFLVPANIPRSIEHLEVRGRIMLDTESGPQLIRPQGELMLQSMLLLIDHQTPKTTLLLPHSRKGLDREHEFRREMAHDLVIKVRQGFGLSTSTMELHEDFLPKEAYLLDGAEHLILASDQLTSDSAGLRSVRDWLIRGGRLWIMLDMVNPDTVRQLLGDAFDFQSVDRVQLSELAWVTHQPGPDHVPSAPRSFDFPVELVRIVTDSGRILHSVQDWPASLTLKYGDGMVLVTTLEARAWLNLSGGGVMGETNQLMTYFLGTPPIARSETGAFQPGLEAQIGYRIPRRRAVLAVFALSSLVLVAGAVGFWRWRRLEWFAVLGPAVSLSAAAAFFGLGAAHKHQLVPLAAQGQYVLLVPEGGTAAVRSQFAVYQPDAGELAVRGTRGGVFWPDLRGLEGETKQVVWSDLDHWQWERLPIPPGIRSGHFVGSVPLKEELAAQGRFGPAGFEGRFLSGGLQDVGDALVALPAAPRLSVELDRQGQFLIDADDVLAKNQFSRDSLLTDEQRRRHDVFRQVFPKSNLASFPLEPTFLIWSSSLDTGLQFPEGFERAGSALLILPLEMQRTPPNQDFFVPSPFLRIESIASAEGQSAAYNPRSGEWTAGLTVTTRSRLRFVLPAEVRPARLDRALLSIKLSAPSRTVDVIMQAGEREVTLKSFTDANGVFTVPVTDRSLLQVDDQGGVRVSVFVSPVLEALSAEKSLAWTIDHVRLDLWGTTEPAPSNP